MFNRVHIKRFTSRLRLFAVNESGMTLPLMALSFLAITGFVGVSVDVARVQLVQSRLSYALDAAGLAAGASFNTSNYTTEISKYMAVNFPAGYLGSSAPGITTTLSNNNTVISMTANTTVPTTFMAIFGLSSVTVTATSQITRTTSGLELVMVLDNTYSMNSSSKMTSLKTAATTLVSILTGGKESVKDLWMGLVPFNQAVNIGKAHADWTNTYSSVRNPWVSSTTTTYSGQAAKDWGGCVEERYATSRDMTDDPPTVEKFDQFFSPSTDTYSWPYSNYNLFVKTRNATTGAPTAYYSGIATNISGVGSGMILGPNTGCPQAVTPLTASASTITTAIGTMSPVGSTLIPVGLVWGWRLLSPGWRDLGTLQPWSDETKNNGLPLNYGTAHMNKAIVLLTDGENSMSNYIWTAYGYLSDGNLGTTNAYTADAKLDTMLTNLCTTIKSHGIYMYTIALGNPGTNVQNLLKSCATSESYYFNSPSASDLSSIFSAIADSLSNLRVSK